MFRIYTIRIDIIAIHLSNYLFFTLFVERKALFLRTVLVNAQQLTINCIDIKKINNVVCGLGSGTDLFNTKV